jgi:hypothetical protein
MPDHPVEQGVAGSTSCPSPPIRPSSLPPYNLLAGNPLTHPARPHRQDRKGVIRLDRILAREPCRYPGSQLKGMSHTTN